MSIRIDMTHEEVEREVARITAAPDFQRKFNRNLAAAEKRIEAVAAHLRRMRSISPQILQQRVTI